jgi:hypothetical protein
MYSDAGLSGSAQISYADARLATEGVITVTFNAKAGQAMRGEIVKLVPMTDASSDIVFYCLAPLCQTQCARQAVTKGGKVRAVVRASPSPTI